MTNELFDGGTALVVIDMQHFFIDAGDGGPKPDAGEALRRVNELVADATRARAPVLFTRDVDPSAAADGHARTLHRDLDLAAGTVIDKGPGKVGAFSAFVRLEPAKDGPGAGGFSDLQSTLHESGAQRLIICGIAADVCVAATAMDARRLGYDVTVPVSATAFVHAHPGGDDAAMRELSHAGVTVIKP